MSSGDKRAENDRNDVDWTIICITSHILIKQLYERCIIRFLVLVRETRRNFCYLQQLASAENDGCRKMKWSFQNMPPFRRRYRKTNSIRGHSERHISAANLSDLETNGSRKRREWAYFSSGPDGVTGNISGSGKETSSLIVGQLKDALRLFLLISYAEKWCYLFSCEISLDGLLTTSWK